jgi:hypothetical protein
MNTPSVGMVVRYHRHYYDRTPNGIVVRRWRSESGETKIDVVRRGTFVRWLEPTQESVWQTPPDETPKDTV